MSDATRRVDPRYDPQFQRGFDGESGSSVVIGSAPARSESDPTIRRHPDPERAGLEDADIDETGVEESGTAPPIRNIPELLLLVLGIASVVGGLLLYSTWAFAVWDGYVGQPDVGDQIVRFLVTALPTPLIVAGIASVLAWLMLRALGARAPESESGPEPGPGPTDD